MWKNKIIFKIKVTVMIYQTLTRTAAEHIQTPVTQKHFESSKQILIA